MSERVNISNQQDDDNIEFLADIHKISFNSAALHCQL